MLAAEPRTEREMTDAAAHWPSGETGLAGVGGGHVSPVAVRRISKREGFPSFGSFTGEPWSANGESGTS